MIALNENPEGGFRRSLTTWLPASLARILFLNSRIQAAPPALGQTLGDALVSEGLSDHFVAEAFPNTPPQPWDHRPMTARQESRIWKRAWTMSVPSWTRLDPVAPLFSVFPRVAP